MASKLPIVIEREYRTRVFKWQFVLLTLLGPIFMLAIMTIPALLMTFSSDTQMVAVIDRTGLYKDVFENTDDYMFFPIEASPSEMRQQLQDDSTPYTAFIEIRQNLLEDPKAFTLFSAKTLPAGLEEYVNSRLSERLSDERLATYGIDSIKDIIRDSKVRVSVPTYRIDENGADTMTSSNLSMILSMVISMAIYMFISIYGSMVMQGVMEEKKSRIMEVMVSSVRPFDLMLGKIIGIGLVGLTQIFIWIVLCTGILFGAQLFFFGALDPETIAQAGQAGTISADSLEMYQDVFVPLASINFFEIVIFAILFFIGGFLMYASIYAALASTISSDEDAPQMMLPVTMIMMLSFYIGFSSVNDPEGSLAVWCSYIPFTSPMVMLARLPYGVSLWEPVLSLVILYATFVALTFLAGKIYRIGVLMYGKKPSFKEIFRWIRHY